MKIRTKSAAVLKRWFSKSGTLIVLFQRAPLLQWLLPEAKILGVAGGSEAMVAIATVAGLGAFDSVAGATVNQTLPTAGGTSFTFTRNTAIGTVTFWDSDGHTDITGWKVSTGSLPPGLILGTTTSRTNTITGTPTTVGTYTCKIQAYNSGHTATSATLTFNITAPAATVSVTPSAPVLVSGQTLTLTASASGTPPFTYQWYQGASGTTTAPVGTNSPSYTTPVLTTATSYWCKVTDSLSTTSNSTAAAATIVSSIVKAAAGADLATAAAWTGGVAPSAATPAQFTSVSPGGSLSLGSAVSWYGIAVNGPTSDINVTGTAATTIGAVGIDMSASTVNMVWAPPIVLGNNQYWKVNTGKTLTVNGVVSGATAYSLSKDGAGTLLLSGANTYIGASNVKGGILKLGNATALGTTAAGTSVALNSTLDLNGQAVSSETLSLIGTGAGGIGALVNNSATAGSWSGAVTMTGDTTFGGTGTATLTGVVSGAFPLTKIGTGTVSLNGANTYSGTTSVSAGTLKIGGSGNLTGGTYSPSMGVYGTFQYASSSAQTLSGIIGGTGTILKDTATSDLTLTGVNTPFTGNVSIKAGRVLVSQDANLGDTAATLTLDGGTLVHQNSGTTGALALGTVTVGASGGTFDVASAFTDSIATLTGSGAFTKASSTGVLNLTGSTGFTGNLTISGGILAVTGSTSLASGSHSGTISNSATLKYSSSAAQTLAGIISGTGSLTKDTSATSILTLTGANTYTGATTLSAGTLKIGGSGYLGGGSYAGAITNNGTFQYSSSANQTLSGAISGTGALIKDTGTGTLTLSNTGSYSGTTTVSAGKLSVNGSLSSSTSAVTVNTGASLGGTGSILRPVTIASGATLAPGNSAGTLSVTGATTVNGTFAVEVDGATADKLSVTGNLTIGAGTTLTVSTLAGGFTQASYVIAECTGTRTGTFTNVPNGYIVTYTATQVILSQNLAQVSVAVAPASVAEDGASNLVYTFTRSGSTAAALTVNFSATGTATAGSDYPTPPASVTIPAGSSTATVTIDPTADAGLESDETVIITITVGSGYAAVAPVSATGTIANDDTAYSSWADALPANQRAMDLTPQNDGVSNLLKFAFNLDPTKPDTRRLTAGGGQTAGLPTASMVGNRIRIEYIRRKAATNPGITYTPQCGSDLTGWALALTNESITPINADWERVTIEGPVGQTKCFGRVKVTSP